ncbi:hypothetical protein [Methanobrevibacter sp.]|uniref:hypothetical protein n=1 Tax=Methanobrevibacter sp. TaxID=66852 RepID=UPI0026E0C1A9|nr:hypothetical protein [Methanobrevibacter sp.]MDO5859542.1 hypothetical protein [Methanobrevibacter sp.]
MKQYDVDLKWIAYEIYGEEWEAQKEIIKQQQEEIEKQQKLLSIITLLNDSMKLFKEIKEKNNLDKETSDKIDEIISNFMQL